MAAFTNAKAYLIFLTDQRPELTPDLLVFLKKVAEPTPFTHVLLNKGALTRTYDEHITISGLQIVVNGVDVRAFQVYGLHGQIAFFYVRDLRIEQDVSCTGRNVEVVPIALHVEVAARVGFRIVFAFSVTAPDFADAHRRARQNSYRRSRRR
jgi:hypothetical protein